MRTPSFWLQLTLPLVFLLLAISWGFSWLLSHPVKQVKVYGKIEFADLEELQANSAPWLEQSFWRLDLKGLKASLETDPWLKEVKLTRHWPGILQIDLTERQAWAHWNSHWLIDNQGEGFIPSKEVPLKLNKQVNAKPEKLAEAIKFWQYSAILLQTNHLQLAKLTFTARGSWQLEVNTLQEQQIEQKPETASVLAEPEESKDIHVYLGAHLVEERMQRFIAAWQGWLAKDAEKISSIDLRYPNGLAVAWLTNAAN